MKYKFIIPFILFTFYNCYSQLPEEFIYVKNEIPTIKTELRYFSENNFVGKKIRGYTTNNLILTKKSIMWMTKNTKTKAPKTNIFLEAQVLAPLMFFLLYFTGLAFQFSISRKNDQMM